MYAVKMDLLHSNKYLGNKCVKKSEKLVWGIRIDKELKLEKMSTQGGNSQGILY